METRSNSVNQFPRIVEGNWHAAMKFLSARCKLQMERNNDSDDYVNSRREEEPMETKFHDGNCRSSCRQTAAVYRVVHPVRTILTS